MSGVGLSTGRRSVVGRSPQRTRSRSALHLRDDRPILPPTLIAARALGVALGVVVGGGNVLRGVADLRRRASSRPTADAMGMLATVSERTGARSRARAPAGAPRPRHVGARRCRRSARPIERQRAAAPSSTTGRVVDLRGRHRQSVLHHRHHRGPARRRRSSPGRASRPPTSTASTPPIPKEDTEEAGDPATSGSTIEEALERHLQVMDATAFALAQRKP